MTKPSPCRLTGVLECSSIQSRGELEITENVGRANVRAKFNVVCLQGTIKKRPGQAFQPTWIIF